MTKSDLSRIGAESRVAYVNLCLAGAGFGGVVRGHLVGSRQDLLHPPHSLQHAQRERRGD